MISHSLAATLNKKFVLEPVVSQSDAFVGFALLTRYTSEAGKSCSAHVLIENMRYEEKRAFLFEQLNVLSSIVGLLEQRLAQAFPPTAQNCVLTSHILRQLFMLASSFFLLIYSACNKMHRKR